MLGLAIVNFKFPASYFSMTETTITLAFNPFATVLAVLAILSWLFCLAVTIFAIVRRTWLGFMPATFFVLMPLITFHMSENDTYYRIGSSVVDRSGTTYSFLMPAPDHSDSFIGKQIEKSGIHVTYEKLVLGDLDVFDGCLWLVRPKNAPETPKLYLTATNILVGNNYKSGAVCVYDLDRGVGYHFDQLNKLSPFLLLTKDDTPSEDDFLSCKGGNDLVDESIAKDLNHPNARVRAMTQELLNDIRKRGKANE